MKKFQSIQARRPKSSKFDLSHERKMSMQMGTLTPIFVNEILPGDKFKVNSEIFMRVAPMIAPIMHRVNVYTHYFFVPNRIIFDKWEDFITGGEDGLSNENFPKMNITTGDDLLVAKGSLADYLGIPTPPGTISAGVDFNALPFRAYLEIYNEYYRDQNVEAKIDYAKDWTVDATDKANLTTLRKRAWEKDYFTSALPWAQRGGEVGTPVDWNYKPISTAVLQDGSAPGDATNVVANSADGGQLAAENNLPPQLRIENLEEEGVTVSINLLRQAIRLQEWLEKNARGGSRYIEQILSHFGVISSDARLQRPEYLGGGRNPVTISEVLSTVPTDLGVTPQGQMAGHGIAVGSSNRFTKRFEEHGYVIGIMSVLPRTTYQQGIPKMFQRFDKLDHYWPEFAHLGEQVIKNNELYFDYADASQFHGTFGYQERFGEYKFNQSSVHGDFRDNLSYWHMGRIFDSQPVLNSSFIQSDPTQRVFAVTDPTEHKLYVQIYNNVKALRPMPYYGTPRL